MSNREPDTESVLNGEVILWELKFEQSPPLTEDRNNQCSWDGLLIEQSSGRLLEAVVDLVSKAHLLATATKKSGAWLNNVLPVPHLGTKLDNGSIHIATGLCLGDSIVDVYSKLVIYIENYNSVEDRS